MNYYVDVPVRIFGGKVAERGTCTGTVPANQYSCCTVHISGGTAERWKVSEICQNLSSLGDIGDLQKC